MALNFKHLYGQFLLINIKWTIDVSNIIVHLTFFEFCNIKIAVNVLDNDWCYNQTCSGKRVIGSVYGKP